MNAYQRTPVASVIQEDAGTDCIGIGQELLYRRSVTQPPVIPNCAARGHGQNLPYAARRGGEEQHSKPRGDASSAALFPQSKPVFLVALVECDLSPDALAMRIGGQ